MKNQCSTIKSKRDSSYIIFRDAFREYDGLWFPKAVHTVTVTTEELLKEIPGSCSLKKSDLLAALAELSELLSIISVMEKWWISTISALDWMYFTTKYCSNSVVSIGLINRVRNLESFCMTFLHEEIIFIFLSPKLLQVSPDTCCSSLLTNGRKGRKKG